MVGQASAQMSAQHSSKAEEHPSHRALWIKLPGDAQTSSLAFPGTEGEQRPHEAQESQCMACAMHLGHVTVKHANASPDSEQQSTHWTPACFLIHDHEGRMKTPGPHQTDDNGNTVKHHLS